MNTIQKVLAGMVKAVLWLVSLVFNKQVLRAIKIAGDYIRIAGIRRRLHSCGKDLWIDSPMEIRGEEYITIGNNVQFRSGLRLDALDSYLGAKYQPSVEIGNDVRINNYCHIGIIDSLVIEDHVLIAGKVYISDHSHGNTTGEDLEIPVVKRKLSSKGGIHIKENAWIGENVSILGGVTIGKGSIVGANSVVNRDVPDYAVVAGCPAKIIKYLKEDE